MSLPDPAYVAVDLGAGSGRVIVARFAPDRFLMEAVRRFHYEPRLHAGRLEWPAAELFAELKTGLRHAGEFARGNGATVTSIGIDSWAVDYGLIDAAGNLLENPVCYRDRRTEGVMEKLFERVSREEIYARTGIQFLPFNTLVQFAAHVHAGLPPGAARLLLIPDLLHFFLTGKMVTEYTNATTTQMLRAGTQDWDTDLLDRLGLPAALLGEIVPAGTNLGALTPQLSSELGLPGADVLVPATHDTASAVVGTPLQDGYAYVSSGTWSLVGVERDAPLINADTDRLNFTNEGGAFGKTRFLKNVMGLWILESCRREWRDRDLDVPYDELLRESNTDEASPSLIFPDDPRCFSPMSMLSALATQMEETGQRFTSDPAACTKAILDSLAFRYTAIVRMIERLTGNGIRGIHIVGGGSRNDYLSQVTANVSGLPVVAGPAEATATGNAVLQAVYRGRFESLQEARRYVADHVSLKRFQPRPNYSWAEAERRYAAIETRYSGSTTLP